MKNIFSLIILGALAVSGFGQTRNVLVGTNNTVVQPTNFWSADASNARAGLGLGTAATNPASAFQPSSAILSNLAAGGGATASNIVGTLSLAQGGTGATNAGGARTNLGLGALSDVVFNNVIASGGIYGETNDVVLDTQNYLLYASGSSAAGWDAGSWSFYVPFNFVGTNAAINIATSRTNLGLGNSSSVIFSNLTLSNGAQTNLAIAIGSTNRGIHASAGPDRINVVVAGVPSLQVYSNSVETAAGISLNLGGNAIINSNLSVGGIVSFINNVNQEINKASSRTNLGLGWPALTNSNAGTGLVSVNTNGEVVSPTNFWQAAPITTTFIESQPTTNFTTNITPARFLHIHSLATNIVNVTNTIVLPTNTLTFEGDVAIVVHKGPTNSMTRVQRAGSTNNLITLTRFDEAVQFVYYNDVWQFDHNIAFVEPIYFSGTNASANAAASRTNLGLGAVDTVAFYNGSFNFLNVSEDAFFAYAEFSSGSNSVQLSPSGIIFVGNAAATTRANLGFSTNLNTLWTATNASNARTAIGLGATNSPTFSGVYADDQSIELGRGGLYGYGAVISLEERRIFSGTNDEDWNFDGSDIAGLGAIQFNNTTSSSITRTNLGLGATNIVTFAGLTNNGDITINQTATNNGLLYIRRTNNEPFLGLANLIASNNTTVSNETLFRVGVAEATNKAAQFGFRSTNTNGNGVAVFSVFGFNALMMIGPSDPAAGTNPIQATVYSVSPTNKVMTLITTNTGAMQMHRPIEWDNTTNSAVTRTNLGLGNGITTNLDIKLDNNAGMRLYFSNGILTNSVTPIP